MMKKIYPILLLALTVTANAQTGSLALFLQNSTVAVVPNSTLYAATSNGNSVTKIIDLKNTSAVSQDYHVKRYDKVLHTVTAADVAEAYFCFGGQDYGSGAQVSIVPLTLAPAQNSGSLVQCSSLNAVLQEASATGLSLVKYTLFNANNSADSIQFSIQYNGLASGISKKCSSSYDIDIFPIPVSGAANIRVNALQSGNVNVIMINAIGQTVYSNEISFVEGSNTLNLDVKEYPAGVYYVILDTGNGTVTKKLTVIK